MENSHILRRAYRQILKGTHASFEERSSVISFSFFILLFFGPDVEAVWSVINSRRWHLPARSCRLSSATWIRHFDEFPYQLDVNTVASPAHTHTHTTLGLLWSEKGWGGSCNSDTSPVPGPDIPFSSTRTFNPSILLFLFVLPYMSVPAIPIHH